MRRLIALIVLSASLAHAVPMGALAVAWAQGGAPTARDYIQDGLVAMWDGIENAGWGEHDPNATEWSNLVSGSPFGPMVVQSGTVSVIEDGWHGNTGYMQSVAPSRYSEGAFSYDLVVSRLFDFDASQSFFSTSQGSGSAYVYDSIMFYNTQPYYHRTPCSERIVSSNFPNGTKTQVCMTADASGNIAYYINGRQIASEHVSPKMFSLNIVRTTYTANVHAKWHRITMYDRALTAEEVAHNYAVDKARFGLP